MRTYKLITVTLAALLSLPAIALASGAPPAGGPQPAASSAPPPFTKPADPAPAAKKEIQPYTGPIEDPETDCAAKPPSQEEIERVRQVTGRPLYTNKCLSQADSLTRASEASSYLGIYMMSNSTAAGYLANPELKKLIQEGIKYCIQENSGKCEMKHQGAILQAMVQYNLLREVRTNQLINSTNAQNMKSMQALDDKGVDHATILDPVFRQNSKINKNHPLTQEVVDRTTRKSTSARTQTFMLDPEKTGKLVNLQAEEEREILGPQFLQDYRAFVDAYARSRPLNPNRSWNYIAAKSRAITGEEPYVIQKGLDGKPMVDENRERLDEKSFENPNMQGLVKRFKDEAITGIKPNKDGRAPEKFRQSNQFKVLNLGLPDKIPGQPEATPAQIAAGVVVGINTMIHQEELKVKGEHDSQAAMKAQAEAQADQARFLSSASAGQGPLTGKTEKKIGAVSVTVSEESFRKFLDDIWPVPGGAVIQ